MVSDHKGINLPGVAVSVPALSDKDVDDLRWALHLRADLVALSFVRSAADVEAVHKIMDEEGIRLPVLNASWEWLRVVVDEVHGQVS
jgi:pyruvate kinase